MSTWRAFEEELNCWHDSGQTAAFWWRDDDAVGVTPAVERLLALAADHGVPIALAVIPATAQKDLALIVAAQAPFSTSVLIHGFAHKNHAAQGEKKSEFGAQRPLNEVDEQILAGQQILKSLFDGRLEPVFVPPWNRIAPAVVHRLSATGVTGLSTFGPRQTRQPAAGLVQANTHVDPVDWHGGRGFAGESKVLSAAVTHLRARRTGQNDRAEPTGLLTHHLVHDEDLWAFTRRFLEITSRHPAARWLTASEVFRGGVKA